MAEPSGIIGGLLYVISWLTSGASSAHEQALTASLARPLALSGWRQPAASASAPKTAQADPEAVANATLIVNEEAQFNQEQYATIEKAIAQASAADPGNWLLKAALAAIHTNRREHEPAMKLAEEACKLAPTQARAWYWKGQTHFNHLSETRSLDAIGEIDSAKAAMLKAIELDPKYISPRMALSMFYIEAPGIVGGSIRKAREQGETMLTLGSKGTLLGRMVLARCAAYKEDWEEATRQYQAMEAAAETPESKCNAVMSLARMQLEKQEEYEDALATAQRALAMAPSATYRSSAMYLVAESKRRLKDLPGAVEGYRQVLELNPDAQRSRFALAECLEQQKRYADAAEQYEAFATRFPKDPKASDATAKAKKLRKKAG